MKLMKSVKIFLVLAVCLCGCAKEEEEPLDIDRMALNEDELSTGHLAGEPLENPQEVLMKEAEGSEPLFE